MPSNTSHTVSYYVTRVSGHGVMYTLTRMLHISFAFSGSLVSSSRLSTRTFDQARGATESRQSLSPKGRPPGCNYQDPLHCGRNMRRQRLLLNESPIVNEPHNNRALNNLYVWQLCCRKRVLPRQYKSLKSLSISVSFLTIWCPNSYKISTCLSVCF